MTNRFRSLLLIAFASLLLFASSTLAADSLIGKQITDFQLPDYLGAKHSLADWADKKALVVAFLGTECPLAKLYAPRLAELAAKYDQQGVQFIAIDANQQYDVWAGGEIQGRDFPKPGPQFLQQDLVKFARPGQTATPDGPAKRIQHRFGRLEPEVRLYQQGLQILPGLAGNFGRAQNASQPAKGRLARPRQSITPAR